MIFNFSDIKEIKNYVLYSLGILVSQFGTVLYTFIMSLYVLKTTDSAMYFSINLAISMIPIIFIMPFAGVFADKGNKKFNVILMDLLSGLLLIGLYLYTRNNPLSIGLIYATTLILASFASVFNVSLGAAKVSIVSDENLVLINSTSDIITSITRILGPLLGGLLFVVINIEIFILLNGVSFILSAVSESFIDFRYQNHEIINEKTNVFEDIKDGYNYVFKRKDLKDLVAIFIIINIAFSLSVIVPLPYIINNVLALSTKSFGIVQAGFPVGIIIGAFIAPKLMKKLSYSVIFTYSLALFSIILLMFGVILIAEIGFFSDVFYMLYYTGTILITGILVSCIDIPIITYMQTKSDKNYLGRVMAIVISSVKIATPLAYILSGYLLNLIRVEFVALIGSIITFLYFLIMKRKDTYFIENSLEDKKSVLDL